MITKTNLKNLRLMTFSQVMKNVQSFLEKETDLESMGLQEAKNSFNKAFEKLELALNPTKKSEHTEAILELDAQRDILLMNFIAHCRLFQTHPQANKSEAAKRCVIQIEAYGEAPQRRAYRDETAIIRNIIVDFEDQERQQDLTLIGAKEWLDLLKSINDQFDTLHTNRTLEKSEKEVGLSKEAREEMQEQFNHLCKAITAMAFVKGEDAYQPLASAINEEVKNALANLRPPRKNKESNG